MSYVTTSSVAIFQQRLRHIPRRAAVNRFCGKFAPALVAVPLFSSLDFRWTNGNRDTKPIRLLQRLLDAWISFLAANLDSNNARFVAQCSPSGWKHITENGAAQRSNNRANFWRGNGNRRKPRRVLAAPLTFDDISALQNSITRWVGGKFEEEIHINAISYH